MLRVPRAPRAPRAPCAPRDTPRMFAAPVYACSSSSSGQTKEDCSHRTGTSSIDLEWEHEAGELPYPVLVTSQSLANYCAFPSFPRVHLQSTQTSFV